MKLKQLGLMCCCVSCELVTLFTITNIPKQCELKAQCRNESSILYKVLKTKPLGEYQIFNNGPNFTWSK